MSTDKAAATKEQRMHPRWTPQSTVSVFEHTSKEYLGLLVDCSESGVMISSYEPLQPGARFELDMVDIPPNIDGRRTGRCIAEVIWNDKITPSLYGNGCTISGASEMLKTMMKGYSHH